MLIFWKGSELSVIELINSKQTAHIKEKHSSLNEIFIDTNSRNKSLDLIIIYAFEQSFKFSLVLNRNGILLSPDLWSKQNNVSNNLPYSNCLFNGFVNNQIESLLYLNLCHKGRIVRFFYLIIYHFLKFFFSERKLYI